jgi:hypothetical protein
MLVNMYSSSDLSFSGWAVNSIPVLIISREEACVFITIKLTHKLEKSACLVLNEMN